MTGELSQETKEKIAVENNKHSNKLKLLIVGTACFSLLCFIVGMVINSVRSGTPLEGGVVSTTILPLIDLLKIISGV